MANETNDATNDVTEEQKKQELENLSELDKAAVRRYVLTLFALPTVLASTLFGATGWAIGSVWTGKAYQDAYAGSWAHTHSTLIDALESAHKAIAQAEAAKDSIKRDRQAVLEIVSELETELDSVRQRSEELNTLTTVEGFKGQLNDIVQTLSSESGFRESVANAVQERVSHLESRIEGIKLVAEDASVSPDFGCGQEQRTSVSNTLVMYGSRDGTSCRVPNRNYYKKLSLVIPD